MRPKRSMQQKTTCQCLYFMFDEALENSSYINIMFISKRDDHVNQCCSTTWSPKNGKPRYFPTLLHGRV